MWKMENHVVRSSEVQVEREKLRKKNRSQHNIEIHFYFQVSFHETKNFPSKNQENLLRKISKIFLVFWNISIGPDEKNGKRVYEINVKKELK